MTRPIYLFVALCLACLCGPAVAETYVIYPDGSGDYTTIQHALINVSDGDVVELADGTYTGEGNRDIRYEGKEVTVRSQSGNPTTCIIDCEGTEGEPHRGFFFQDTEDPTAVLEGVTITNGWIAEPDCGGAVKIASFASPTFINCRFVDNYGDCIGGIFMQNASADFTDCVFEGNTTSEGYEAGGLFVGNNCTSVLRRCTFVGNSSSIGGGLLCRYNAAVTLIDCLIIDNGADMGGGIYCRDDTVVSIENCTFAGNDAPTGANIFCNEQASLTITNSIVANSVGGDAIECLGTSLVTISCCDVWNNPGGDWVGCIAGLNGVDGNISVDPCFCLDSYYIAETSPCATANNACGVLIGALDEQCVDCGGEVPTLETTWGQLKAGYR